MSNKRFIAVLLVAAALLFIAVMTWAAPAAAQTIRTLSNSDIRAVHNRLTSRRMRWTIPRNHRPGTWVPASAQIKLEDRKRDWRIPHGEVGSTGAKVIRWQDPRWRYKERYRRYFNNHPYVKVKKCGPGMMC